jgi:carbon storage regulator
MLVLTRRISESLIVGEGDVTFTILGIIGNQVRVGIRANKHIAIDREEVYWRKQNEKEKTFKTTFNHTP